MTRPQSPPCDLSLLWYRQFKRTKWNALVTKRGDFFQLTDAEPGRWVCAEVL